MTAPAMTFINLPVANLDKTVKFYSALGFTFNPQFTDETAACMVINDTTFAMLLTREKFKSFSNAPIPDAHTSTGLMVAIALDNAAAVDAMMEAALKAGGQEPRPPIDLGFMYNRTFSDPDGHRWEPFHMNMADMPKS